LNISTASDINIYNNSFIVKTSSRKQPQSQNKAGQFAQTEPELLIRSELRADAGGKPKDFIVQGGRSQCSRSKSWLRKY